MAYKPKYFSDMELSCNCGCGRKIVSDTLTKGLDRLREAIGGPVNISCAYRCPTHNAEVGGVRNSQHVLGTAADVLRPDHLSFGEFKWYVEQYAKADGIGLYPDSDFIHIDYRDDGNSPGAYNWSE